MTEPVLVIMAAGMGSRYGGLKQLDPMDEQGNLIIDFSIYDAVRVGFQKIVFIIKHEIEEEFKKRIGNRIAEQVKVEYVYQEIDNIPEGYQVPAGRNKPWGTGHAILSCRGIIDGPFAVINADDYYGKQAYQMIYDSLITTSKEDHSKYYMVGYQLMNTLTENGHVARGICSMDEHNKLIGIQERVRIEKRGEQAEFTEDDGITWEAIPASSIVSMNLWGFQNNLFRELEHKFKEFLVQEASTNPLMAEYFLPSVVGELLKERKATVKVLRSKDKWYGVTYREDKETVIEAIRAFKESGIYPARLWH